MRAQSHVVGVALMLGLTVTALGGLTVGVGTVLESQAAAADADRVASELDAALDATGTTGPHGGRVSFSEGSLRTVDRSVRVLRNGTVVRQYDAGGLVFEAGDRRVAYVAGAVVRGGDGNSWLVAEPPVTDSARNGVVVVGVPRLGTTGAGAGGSGGVTATLETNVSHRRVDLGRGRFAVAVETAAPAALERYFRERSATVSRRDFDGDGVSSVLARYPDRRQGYVVVHDLRLEVAG
jgi:hypothetical protein